MSRREPMDPADRGLMITIIVVVFIVCASIFAVVNTLSTNHRINHHNSDLAYISDAKVRQAEAESCKNAKDVDLCLHHIFYDNNN